MFYSLHLFSAPVATDRLKKISQQKKNIRSGNVQCSLQDNAGNLWFGTADGLYKYDGESFTRFVVADGLNSNSVSSLLEDKEGNIWFGGRTNKGVFRYDGKSITNFKLKELTLQFESKRVVHNWAWPQLQDKNGNLWFGGDGGRLFNLIPISSCAF
ncbi:MAG TPA: two-component regulator propeller domain-containing protein [Flavilitoribacter sp.]|nr:two-component regulator propeller domain-containing protein [Flavilitoribacter sp.]HMQ90495.1 two-component regulator propeller domain-containing protein [Flavilitoribacter sp.]